MIQDLISACGWDSGKYLIFSNNVFSPLIYYSHLTPIFVSLVFGIYIYLSNRRSLLNKTLLFITIILGLWLLLDLVLWATDSLRIVLFSWSIVNVLEPIVYAGFVYFTLLFVTGVDVSQRKKFFLILPLLPTILLASTHWNVLGFDLTNCDREVIEGPVAYYNYFIEIGYVMWIGVIGVLSWKNSPTKLQRNQSTVVVGVILLLLLGFASGNIIGSFSEDWALGQFGLFVIPVSIGALAYFVVQFRLIARSQIMAAQILVIGLWLAVGSILFLQNVKYVHIITGVTLVFLTILGYLLIQSFQTEIRQRKEIENLAHDLQIANNQQVTLIHFITHQIKGFVGKSRNIFSMLMEGDYGKTLTEMMPILEQGFQSDTKGVATIQEILNAANIKSGKVTYKKEPFDLKELTTEIVGDLKAAADAKKLALTVNAPEGPLTISGDRMQMQNALKNLIDNSIKYTLSGSVAITFEKEAEKVRMTVQDTGVGITEEDMQHLFTEGGHGKESQKINVDSTGFGLYIVKNIIEAHQGKVWAESEGAGKGARFIVELPVS